MKSRCTLIILLGFISFFSYSQESSTLPSLAPGHYVVVAAYLKGQVDFAQRFAAKINLEGKHAKTGYDEIRSLNYVYLDYYADFNESVQQMLKTRQEGVFPTAWVRVMKGEITNEKVATSSTVVPVQKEVKKEESKKEEPKPEAVKEEPKVVVVPTTSVPDSAAKPFVPMTFDAIDNPTPDPVYRPQILTNTPVFLSLYNPTNNLVVDGEVEVVNTETSQLITKVKGNDYVKLPDPKSKTGQLTLISSSFGFRKIQHEINYKSTESDTLQPFISLVGNYYMIRFDMSRIHRGDIETLYNVYFYNDAAIMQPESKYELNNLLKMMNDNPTFRILLHGHTNGGGTGKLITRGESNKFFEITADVKRGIGTAKELSKARAEVIRDWLVANGVATDRMEIKAWGGSRMIHDKNSVHARKNVRVEVELIQE